MKYISAIVTSISIIIFASHATAQTKIYQSSYGFKIETFEPPDTTGQTFQALIMSAPLANGLSPNINVQVQQPFSGTLKQFLEVSKLQLSSGGTRLIAEHLSNDSLTMEYVGMVNGHRLHFYQKAVLQGKKVFLATGTAPESSWSQFGAKIKKSVDSLGLEK